MSGATNIFVYGTLRDQDILMTALGPEFSDADVRVGTARGVRAAKTAAGPYPGLVKDADAAAPGLLLRNMSDEAVARLVYFEACFSFDLIEVEVDCAGEMFRAEIFWPNDEVDLSAEDWRLEDWQQSEKPLFLAMARDVMAVYPDGGHKGPMILRMGAMRRAVASLRAAGVQPADLRSEFGRDGIHQLHRRRNFTGFFAAETLNFRFRTFGGGLSETVDREVMVTGDAVSVLPWDPVRDTVLLIEQVRAAPVARGDSNPWSLEVIAGLLDRMETPEDAARREAQEEAGLELGRMEKITSFYSSPGALTENMTCFLAEADLSGEGGIHGLASEAEDIRSMIVPFATAMAALESGEAANAPIVVSLMALAARKERLEALWG
ncbi:NUDIX domain-containing protein [Algicella marina]|uniref:ADP-ribose pyrophosphatase n=1 Tax=Algicella marina TaxID=2683284 RepID=A0A6P1T139_9RHOB|nr:NUDIX domain-containing protein [Algicella marina]QHQ35451.1 NUDIX domain-containing protein [Algicella marina]